MKTKVTTIVAFIISALNGISLPSFAESIPPPIEQKHPAAEHTLEDLVRHSQELRKTLELGKPGVDIQRTEQEILRMRNIQGTLCRRKEATESSEKRTQCEKVKNDLVEADRMFRAHHGKPMR